MFQFYKERNPVRLTLDVLDHSDVKSLSDDEINMLKLTPITQSVHDWLGSFRGTRMFKRSNFCWHTISSKSLLPDDEQRTLINELYCQ